MSAIEETAGDGPETPKAGAGEGKYQSGLLRREIDELRLVNDAKDVEIKRLRQKLIERQGTRKSEETADGDDSGEPAAPRLRPPSMELAAAKANLATREEEMKKLTAETVELRDKYLRARAELENVVRRAEKEKADASKYAISEFARDVLGMGDTIQRAIALVPPEAAANDPALASFLEGVQMIEREMLATMERYGITRLDPQHERFDPNMHQAVMELEDAEVPQGTVVKVFQPGYTIAERVLRPAIVAVSRGGAKLPKAAVVEVVTEVAATEPEPHAANDDPPEPSAP